MTTEQKQPSHRIYHADDKNCTMPLGEAWAHSDGKGYDLNVDRLPIGQSVLAGGEFDGRLTLRVIEH